MIGVLIQLEISSYKHIVRIKQISLEYLLYVRSTGYDFFSDEY